MSESFAGLRTDECAHCGCLFEQAMRRNPYRVCSGCRNPSEKTCGRCGETKAAEEFYGAGNQAADGLSTYCKPCTGALKKEREDPAQRREYQRKWYSENKERLRDYDLRRNYGITQAEYDEMLAQQDGACAICRSTDPGQRRFHVDHDHETDVVRGLLCSRCNTGIGLLNEDVERLHAAITYLQGSA